MFLKLVLIGDVLRYSRPTLDGISVYKVYQKLNKAGIFKIVYTDLLRKYLMKCPGKKLRYVLTDTSFVPNKKGTYTYGYNRYYRF